MENEVFKISIFWKLGIVQVRLFGTLRVLRCSYSDFWEKEENIWSGKMVVNERREVNDDETLLYWESKMSLKM